MQFCCQDNDINCTGKNYGSGCEHKKDKIFERMKKDGYFCFIRSKKLNSYSDFHSLSKEQAAKELAQNGWAYCAYCARNIIKNDSEPIREAIKSEKICNGCVICLLEYTANEIVRSCPSGHVFHLDCIDKWMETQGNRLCPSCKEKNILYSEFTIKQDEQSKKLLCNKQVQNPDSIYICKNINGELDRDFDLSDFNNPKDDIYEKIMGRHK